MIEREIQIFLIAYNFMRALMAEAAAPHDLDVFRISFKGTLDSLRSFLPALMRAPSKRSFSRLRKRLLDILCEDLLPLRPHRCEPRAVKKRMKPYSLLTRPRRTFKTIPHRGKAPNIRPQTILT